MRSASKGSKLSEDGLSGADEFLRSFGVWRLSIFALSIIVCALALAYTAALASNSQQHASDLARELIRSAIVETELMPAPDYTTAFSHEGQDHIVNTHCSEETIPEGSNCARVHVRKVKALQDELGYVPPEGG